MSTLEIEELELIEDDLDISLEDLIDEEDFLLEEEEELEEDSPIYCRYRCGNFATEDFGACASPECSSMLEREYPEAFWGRVIEEE